MKRFHGDNERLDVRSLWVSLQFYALTVKRMLSAGGVARDSPDSAHGAGRASDSQLSNAETDVAPTARL